MAGPHEIAIGIASVLGKPSLPNPLTISFRGQSLESASEVVRAIMQECSDAAIDIELIEMDPELYRHMAGLASRSSVRLAGDDNLVGDIKLHAKQLTP